MTLRKRLFDLLVALILTPFVLPTGVMIAAAILLLEGGPVFYRSERMKSAEAGFTFWKFRTMRHDPLDSGVTGADKLDRITPLGRFLRRSRLDELPQLINLWRGDISVVGPRAPLRSYVERFPALYARVLQARPGITGLATVMYNRHETLLLSRSQDPFETDAIYARSCVPRKARLDLIYLENRGFCFDLSIIAKTFLPFLR